MFLVCPCQPNLALLCFSYCKEREKKKKKNPRWTKCDLVLQPLCIVPSFLKKYLTLNWGTKCLNATVNTHSQNAPWIESKITNNL